MPRRPGFRTSDVEGLVAELQFAPRETLLRIAERAESLVGEIKSDAAYPADFVVFKLTGFRPRSSGESIDGTDLLADLPTLVLHLSDRAQLVREEVPRSGRPLPEIAEQLGLSLKSLQRYRTRGLVCHMVRETAADPPRLICFDDALAAFQERHGEMIERAASFSRLDDADESVIREEAERLAAAGCSIHEAAQRISAEIDRAPETVRRILVLLDRRTGLFGAHGRLSDRDAAIIDRARRMGIPLTRLAEHYGKTAATIRRAALRARAQWLRSRRPKWIDLPTFELVDAERIILGAAPVTEHLDELIPRSDALHLLTACDAASTPSENDIAAMLAGLNLLHRQAALRSDAMEAWPAAREVDAAETQLRWAAQIRRRLISLLLPVVMKRLRTGGGLLPEALPKEELRAIIRRSVDLVAREIERADALRAVRFGRRIAFVADLHAAHEAAQWRDRSHRALVRHREGTVRLDDPLIDVLPWGTRLDLPPRFVQRLDRIDEGDAGLLRLHYGLSDRPAETILSLAEQEGSTESRIVRQMEAAIDALRAVR